jgi:myo-inositol-1(or 4)-monophosphatase
MSTVTPKEAAQFAAIALEVAREAGDLAVLGYRRPKVVSEKIVANGDFDLVTEFDMASEELVRRRLREKTPGIAVVAEEGGGEPGVGATWYVDPIDGTRNYASGHPFWCVSIGLSVGGSCVAGAVVAPTLGAWWRGSSGAPTVRDGELCKVNDTVTMERALVATGFPFDRRTSSDNNLAAFAALELRVLDLRRCGSAALDLAFVADGTYGGYWEPRLSPWDLAAGICIVEGAGGKVTDFDGKRVELGLGDVVASNGRLHDDLLRALAAAGR